MEKTATETKEYVFHRPTKKVRKVHNGSYIVVDKRHVRLQEMNEKDYYEIDTEWFQGRDSREMNENINALQETYLLHNTMPIPFFRKWFTDGDNNHEQEIVTMLKKNPDVCCPRILRITDKYYDAELLDLYHASNDVAKKKDIKKCLERLHDMDIIYVDLKEDNIGYSHVDKKWKIFDFDSSGICAPSKDRWIREPPFYYQYKTAYKLLFPRKYKDVDVFDIKKEREVMPLTRIDNVLFKALFH